MSPLLTYLYNVFFVKILGTGRRKTGALRTEERLVHQSL